MVALKETLVCFAVKEEAQCFRELAASRPGIRVLITGMGGKNAEKSVREALKDNPPGLVLSCGFAGGLRPGLKRGTVLFADAENTGLLPALQTAGAIPARFYGSLHVITNPEEKQRLRATTGADAVEMESFVICGVSRELGIPSATVRVILDEAGDELPLDFNQVLTEDLKIDPRKLAFALLKAPGRIPGLLRLRQQSNFAARQLAQVLNSVLPEARAPRPMPLAF